MAYISGASNMTKLLNYPKKWLEFFSKYNAHTDPIFKKEKLLKLRDIIKLQELKFYYKYK